MKIRKEQDISSESNEVESLREKANEAGEKLHNLYSATTDEVVHTVDKVGDTIREKPFKSSFVALAAGFVVGALLCRL